MRASHARTREGTALSSNRWAPHTHRSEAVLVPHVHLGAFAEEGLDRDRVAVAAREVQRGDVVGGLGRHLARHAGARFSWETREKNQLELAMESRDEMSEMTLFAG